jgi:hypothetical protein
MNSKFRSVIQFQFQFILQIFNDWVLLHHLYVLVALAYYFFRSNIILRCVTDYYGEE